MKKSTMVFAVLGGIGLMVIFYLATRPRAAASDALAAGDGPATDTPGANASRLVGSIGTGLTAIAASVAEAAS